MSRSRQLSAPLYEALPWAYIAGGLLALLGSYMSTHGPLSFVAGAIGLAGVLAGVVVLLRRRDYRALHSQYRNPGTRLPGSDDSQP
jgi:ABC-type Mn2+/Zn2+ transport system permease subunit